MPDSGSQRLPPVGGEVQPPAGKALDKIDSILLVITAECNLRCRYCYQNAKKPWSMDEGVVRAALDLARISGQPRIEMMFLGGEPLLEIDRIRAAVRRCHEHCPADKSLSFGISTNGLLMTEEIAAFLDEHRFQIQLSFDGVSEAQEFRAAGSFALIDGLLDSLRNRHPDTYRGRLRVCVTLVPPAVPYLSASIEYLLGKGVAEIALAPTLKPFGAWEAKDIDRLDAQFCRILRASLEHYEKTGAVPLLLFRPTGEGASCEARSRGLCAALRGETVTIDVGGQVYGCVLFAESYQQFAGDLLKRRLGALRIGDLREADLPERYARFLAAGRRTDLFADQERKYSGYGPCRDCEHQAGCRICPVAIGYDPDNADPDRVPDFACAFSRVALGCRKRFLGRIGKSAADPFARLDAILASRRRKDQAMP